MKVSVCLVSEIFEGAGNFRIFFVSDKFSDGRFGFSVQICFRTVGSDPESMKVSVSMASEIFEAAGDRTRFFCFGRIF